MYISNQLTMVFEMPNDARALYAFEKSASYHEWYRSYETTSHVCFTKTVYTPCKKED